jgi:hypothetical protein
LAKESFADCADALQVYLENEAKLTRFGRILKACKAKVAHGEWQNWVRETFAGHLSLRAVQVWISDADNPDGRAKRLESKRQYQARVTAKAHHGARLPEPDPQPEPEKPEPAPEPLSQPCAPRDTRAPGDPPTLPRTNTHHTPANRQQIDRGEQQPAPARYREGQVYIYRDGELREANAWDCVAAGFSEEELLDAMIESTNSAAIFARIMRRKAAEIDPQNEASKPEPKQKAGKVPTVQQLLAESDNILQDKAPQDPSGNLRLSVHSWARHKQGLTGKDRVRSLDSWQTAVARICKVAQERGIAHVCELIERAIANGYVGWEHTYGSDRKPQGFAATRVYDQARKAVVKYDDINAE